MAAELKNYKKNKQFLLCVDSDGCAMDTMNIKHFNCFGPCFVQAWEITENVESVLERWNEINLFELTRGINRFLGFARLARELYPNDEDIKAFESWTRAAKELSEKAVFEEWKKTGNHVFERAYEWSKAVNKAIVSLPEESKIPFEGVRDGLKNASKNFDIAIVSSANYAAVTEEWERCELLQLTDAVTTQQDGSKAHCIAELIKKATRATELSWWATLRATSTRRRATPLRSIPYLWATKKVAGRGWAACSINLCATEPRASLNCLKINFIKISVQSEAIKI